MVLCKADSDLSWAVIYIPKFMFLQFLLNVRPAKLKCVPHNVTICLTWNCEKLENIPKRDLRAGMSVE